MLFRSFSANNIYLSLQRGADRLWWNRPTDFESMGWRQLVARFIGLRLKAFLLILFLAPLIVLDQWISNIRFLGFAFVRAWVDPWLPVSLRAGWSVSFGLDMVISFFITSLVTLVLLWWLPSRPIPWRPLVPAAAFAGSAITLLNLLLGRSIIALGLRFQAYGVVEIGRAHV